MIVATQKDYLLCIQITDTHLFANPEEKLLGIPTADSLQKVIDLIKKEQRDIDLVVVTGDISQDGTLGSYQLFQQQVNRLEASSIWTAGNHDNFACIENLSGFKNHLINQQDIGQYWRVITLNSQVIGENHGKVSREQLESLLQSLKSSKRFHLIGLHHPPFSAKAKWLNDIKLQESWELLDCLEYFLNANVILCGHVHQVYEIYYRGTYLFSTPSTCLQFAPNADTFKLDTLAPGYRWLKLFNDGRIDTGVSYLKENPYSINLDSVNY